MGGTGVGGTGVGDGANVAVGGAVGVAGEVGLGVGVAVALAPQAVATKTSNARARTNRVLRVFIENLLIWVGTPLCSEAFTVDCVTHHSREKSNLSAVHDVG